MNIKNAILKLPLVRDPVLRGRVLALPRLLEWKVLRVRRQARGHALPQMAHIESFNPRGSNVFFGYYDINPASRDGTKVLAHLVPGIPRPLKKARPAKVGFFDLAQNSEFVELGNTTAWCWQMGARLRWLPGTEDTLIVYNSTSSGRHGASIVDIDRCSEVRRLDAALYDITSDGTVGLTLDFARLARLRPGYGYVDLPDNTASQLAPADNGIWRVDMQSGERDLLFSLDAIARHEDASEMEHAIHYFNHISIAPGGDRFIFFHIWVEGPNQFQYWKARLFSARIDGSDLHLLAEDANPSHYAWTADGRLLVTMVSRDGSGTEYRLFDGDRVLRPFKPWLPACDGHPSFSPDQRFLLNDSYPDQYGEQTLEVYDLATGQRTDLGHYAVAPYLKGELRCDLHPRWSPDGRWVYFDSTHRGKRAIYRVQFPI